MLAPPSSRQGAALLFDSGELSAPAATFDVQNLSQVFVDLAFVLTARGDTAATNVNVTLTLNADAGANYDGQQVTGIAAAVAAQEQIGTAGFQQLAVSAASAPAGTFTALEGTLFGYSSTVQRTILHVFADRKTADATGGEMVKSSIGHWRSTVAVTRVTFATAAGNFAAGSRLRLYGRA